MSAKIFAELVEQIIVFKDKTVTLVFKIDKDLIHILMKNPSNLAFYADFASEIDKI